MQETDDLAWWLGGVTDLCGRRRNWRTELVKVQSSAENNGGSIPIIWSVQAQQQADFVGAEGGNGLIRQSVAGA